MKREGIHTTFKLAASNATVYSAALTLDSLPASLTLKCQCSQ